ncbi:MAG: M48 family metallopeptidase [Aestuariivirga sp.]|uniref:M48 family metallopeptidase n=1 Tax=Aestuariivirga sp. TaxID=2650926 RepID=UPI0025BD7E5D|nr:M48 family metallopeptidase [Aestuariivirga sp.]MCA3560458.1 M48 family metallopeptidase [Aestuariivirga sp.]
MDVAGLFFDAQRSLSRPARLARDAEGLSLLVDGEEHPRRPQLRGISEKLGRLPRKLSFADGSLLEVPADAPVDGLLPRQDRFFAVAHWLEASWKYAAAAGVITILLLAVTYRYGLPLAARAAADITPPAISGMMNEGTLDTVDRFIFEPSKLPEQRTAHIRALFAGLTAPLVETQDYELLFRDGGRIGPNAIALPGGTIIITDQLIELARSDDEILGVLAHEVGHVEQRHSLQQVYRALGLSALVVLAGGDSGQLVHDAVNQAAVLQTFAYSREFEDAADKRSVAIMVSDGRNPLAFIDLLDRITAGASGSDQTTMLSTHPGAADRRAAAEAEARALGWCKDCPTDESKKGGAQ